MGNVTGGTVLWILEVPTDKFDAALDRSSRKAEEFGHNLDKIGTKAASNFGSELGNAFSSIGSGLGRLVKGFAIAGAAGSVGFGAMVTAALDQQKAVENARFALRAYEGDASKVNTVLSDLVDFATSPLGTLFQREELFKAASNLKVFGDETTDLTNHIKIMSRVVALGFTSFDELSQILGRVGAAGKLTGVDFDVLTARGVRLPETMRNAAVSFDDLFKAVGNAIPEGVLEGRADSIEGRLIRLKSSFRNLGASILGIDRDTNEFIEGGLGDRMLKLLDNLRITLSSPEIKTAFTNLGKSVADFAERAIPLLIAGLSFIARNINTIVPIFVALTAAFVAAKIAAIGFAIATAVAAGPATLIAAGVIALIAVLAFLVLRFDVVRETIASVFNWVKDNWPLILGILTGPIGIAVLIITRNFDTIRDGLAKVIDFFKKLPGNIVNAMGNLGTVLFNAGKDLIQGLISGAGSLLSKIGQFMADKLPSAIQGPFKKALGISSPSIVFAGYGRNITQGLVQGIQDSQSMLDGAMGGLTTDIAGPTLAPNVIGGVNGDFGGVTEIENNIGTINIASEVDGQNWLQKLTRDQEIINRGLTPGVAS